MERWKKTGSRVIILANGPERIERVKRVLQDYHIEEPVILDGNLQAGFEQPSIHLVVITEGEMFTQKQRKVRKVDKKLDNAERIKSYQELKIGDYVVHVNHGIGKYVGIGTLEINGIHKDYIHILYAAETSCPCRSTRSSSSKSMSEPKKKEPKIYKLGGADWARVKSKARASVKDIATI